MNYNILSTFDDSQLLDGMQAYYQNAQNLLETSRDLANKQKYGLATAMSVLSIEELIKAFATFQVYIGETKAETIDPAFKANNIHKTRLKLASGYNLIFDLIDQDNLKQTITEKVESMDGYGEYEFHTTDELLDLVDKLIDTISPTVTLEAMGIPNNFEDDINKKINDYLNWYSHAQKHKEKGMYADFLDNKWHLPQNMEKSDYDEALTCATETFDTIGNPIKEMIQGDDLKRKVIRRIIKKIKSTGGNIG